MSVTYSSFVVYDAAGVVLRFGQSLTSDLPLQAQAGESVLEVETLLNNMYVDLTDPANPVIGEQAPMPYTVTGNVISDLPIPCKATYEGTTYDVPDGTITVDADFPGEYVVTVTAVAYISTNITVTVP